ncbi:MAG: septum formation initiator family protein [Alphaproteobacteria bacterium]|jgi:cell division protein FtsB|nr:MAG: hypothetical protein BHW58_02020 [Azospirillum sp. 51_20]
MGFLFDLKSRLKSSGIYIAFTLVIFYFGFYAFYGERGIRKYLYLRHEVEYARTLAKQYRVKKERLAEEVRLLSPDSLDLDLLDERARIVLNFVGDDEFVILDE